MKNWKEIEPALNVPPGIKNEFILRMGCDPGYSMLGRATFRMTGITHPFHYVTAVAITLCPKLGLVFTIVYQMANTANAGFSRDLIDDIF